MTPFLKWHDFISCSCLSLGQKNILDTILYEIWWNVKSSRIGYISSSHENKCDYLYMYVCIYIATAYLVSSIQRHDAIFWKCTSTLSKSNTNNSNNGNIVSVIRRLVSNKVQDEVGLKNELNPFIHNIEK